MFVKKKYYAIAGLIIAAIVLAIGVVVWFASSMVHYAYDSNSVESYDISVNYRTGETTISKTSSYSIVDNNVSSNSNGEERGTIVKDYNVVLTTEERNLFKQAVKINEKSAFDAIVCIAQDNLVAQSDVEDVPYDYDGDGQVLYREYGKHFLETIIGQSTVRKEE